MLEHTLGQLDSFTLWLDWLKSSIVDARVPTIFASAYLHDDYQKASGELCLDLETGKRNPNK